MCDDCQTYAHWLGEPERILDEHGGTDVFQLTPAQLRIDQGHEHVRCVRLSSKGLMRWYAGCCKTPIANTLASPRVPFAGVLHTFMDHQGDGRSRDEVLGPVRARTQGRFAPGGCPDGASPRAPVGIIFRALRHLLGGLVSGAHRPSPFFEASGRPVVEPTVVPPEERRSLRDQLGF